MHIVTRNSVIVILIVLSCILVSSIAANNQVGAKETISKISISPITIKEGNFVTFMNRQHPNNRIGYRIFEHTPIVYGEVPKNIQEAGIDLAQITKLEKGFLKRPGVITIKHRIKSKHWIRQDWIFYMVPVHNGVDMLLTVETHDEGLPSYYGVQQCFRMSGEKNSHWRHKIAKTPAFSEYDLWAREKDQPEKTSLTYVLRQGRWQILPATTETVGARTPLGLLIDTKRTGGKPMNKVGPYKAKMLEPVDCGLITRTNQERTWISGLFWELTSHLTNHHPADCLHAIVNIGGIPPHAKRAFRGKVYWFKGTKNDLEKGYKYDFPK